MVKDIFSAFGTEVFRPLVTLVLPGSLALSTWLVGTLQRYRGLYNLVNGNHAESILVILLAAIFAGLIIEDIGSRVEYWFDCRLTKKIGDVFRDSWSAYLRMAFKTEPTGRRYLRALVMRLKFELGAAIGLVMGGGGLFTLLLPWHIKIGGLGFALALAGYLGYEAVSTHRNLHELRCELLKGVTVVG